MSTNFEKVVEFNKQFGITTHEKPVKDIFDQDSKLVDYRLSLVAEEFKELQQAIKEKDYTETIDALCDLLYVICGFGSSIGTNLDDAFDIVHNSNMSKLCKTEEEAKQTVEYYHDHKELGYLSPCYRKSTDGKYYVVYNKDTMKILKSINYTPANFSELLK